MTHYVRRLIKDLPSLVGVDCEDGARILEDVEGFGSYGPHCRLTPGRYFGGFHLKALRHLAAPDLLHIDVCRQEGGDILADRRVAGRELCSSTFGLVGVGFSIDRETPDVEVRLRVSSAAAVVVRDLVIFRHDLGAS